MLQTLRWFAPPELPRADLRRRARALWLLSWPLFLVVALLLSAAVIVEPETAARRATTIAAIGALVLALHAVSRGGRPVLASWAFVIGLCLIVTQRAWITGGIHAPIAAFYVVFIVLGGVLLGGRGGVAAAAVCVAGAIVLTLGTARAWLAAPPNAGPALGALMFVLLTIGLALVLHAMVSARPRRGGVDADAVQMIVHDMRSPLHAVLAHLELLREEIRGERAADVEGAMAGASRLHRMTTNLLDVSRLEAGRMPVAAVATDLGALARSVVDGVRVLQPGRQIDVQTAGDSSSCLCDPELTRRILENLVMNAIKHTPVACGVRVAISRTNRWAQIAVHDEGPGVPAAKRAQIFEPYGSEAVRSAAGYESSGLGLAFCKLAAEAQGGSIRIEQGRPSGTVFVVDLPCA